MTGYVDFIPQHTDLKSGAQSESCRWFWQTKCGAKWHLWFVFPDWYAWPACSDRMQTCEVCKLEVFFVSQYFMWFVALLIVPNDSRCLRLTCLFCFGHFAPQVARCLSSSSKWWFGTASGRHARVSVWQNGRKLCTENDLRLANKRRMPQPSG